jgi:hypothetical protein
MVLLRKKLKFSLLGQGSSKKVEDGRTYRYVKADSWSMALLNVPPIVMLDNLLQIPGFSRLFFDNRSKKHE